MNRIIEALSSLRATIVGGVFLAASLVLLLTGTTIPVDPAWATILICGIPLAFEAFHSLFVERKITSALLITIAMVASVAIGELFAAGEVAFIMAIGEMLEEKTVQRAKKGIKTLISLAPETGRRLTATGEELVSADQIKRATCCACCPERPSRWTARSPRATPPSTSPS